MLWCTGSIDRNVVVFFSDADVLSRMRQIDRLLDLVV